MVFLLENLVPGLVLEQGNHQTELMESEGEENEAEETESKPFEVVDDMLLPTRNLALADVKTIALLGHENLQNHYLDIPYPPPDRL